MKPIAVMHSIVRSDKAKGCVPGVGDETKNEPAMAVPSDDPRFETLRDKPDISP